MTRRDFRGAKLSVALRGLSVLFVAAPPMSSYGAEVVDVRLGWTPEYTRVVFELDEPAPYKVFRDSGKRELAVEFLADSVERHMQSPWRPATTRPGKKSLIDSIKMIPTYKGSQARIALARGGLSLKEMVLRDPPRIVLDVFEIVPEEPVVDALLQTDEIALSAAEAKAARTRGQDFCQDSRLGPEDADRIARAYESASADYDEDALQEMEITYSADVTSQKRLAALYGKVKARRRLSKAELARVREALETHSAESGRDLSGIQIESDDPPGTVNRALVPDLERYKTERARQLSQAKRLLAAARASKQRFVDAKAAKDGLAGGNQAYWDCVKSYLMRLAAEKGWDTRLVERENSDLFGAPSSEDLAGAPPQSRPKSSPRPVPLSPSTPAAKADKTPPSIDIAEAITVDSDSPTLAGRVSDAHRVVEVRVEGTAVELAADGRFSFTRYVPEGGASIRIRATDEWGNTSEKIVKVSREAAGAEVATFAALDPTGFSGKENGDAVALIIGIGSYKRAADARYADRDARFFADYARRKLGVPKRNVKMLINEKADSNDIKEVTKLWLPAATRPGKTDIYVFFAGHGLGSDDGDEVYLLPYSGIPELLGDTALVRSELFAALEAVNPRSVTLFLDTCYSGTSREETLVAARPLMIVAEEQAIPEGFTVFSATSMKQTAKMLPEAQHGLFSYFLMRGLEGAADDNGDRKITAGELHAYVLGEAEHLRRNQTPQFQGDADRVLVRW